MGHGTRGGTNGPGHGLDGLHLGAAVGAGTRKRSIWAIPYRDTLASLLRSGNGRYVSADPLGQTAGLNCIRTPARIRWWLMIQMDVASGLHWQDEPYIHHRWWSSIGLLGLHAERQEAAGGKTG